MNSVKEDGEWKSVYVAGLSKPMVRDRRDNRDVWAIRIGTSWNWPDTVSNTLRTGLPVHDQGVFFRFWTPASALELKPGLHPADGLRALFSGLVEERGGFPLERSYIDAGPDVDIMGLEQEFEGLAQRHLVEVWNDEGVVAHWARLAKARARKR